jgi:hypothetical protein
VGRRETGDAAEAAREKSFRRKKKREVILAARLAVKIPACEQFLAALFQLTSWAVGEKNVASEMVKQPKAVSNWHGLGKIKNTNTRKGKI